MAARLLIAHCGSLKPNQLSAAHAHDLNTVLENSRLAKSTKQARAMHLRKLLRYLWEHHGSPKLDEEIHRYTGVKPRNNTVTREEIEAMIDRAPQHLRVYILLCADLGIRSGTAARLGPQHYNPESRTLHFVTKGGTAMTLPVTAELQELIDQCDHNDSRPFVAQLWQYRGHGKRPGPDAKWAHIMRIAFRHYVERLGFNRRIIPHDLRRTVAVRVLELTGDLRDVQAVLGHASIQATVKYLDHDLRPVKRSTLELIKRPAWRKEQTA